MRADRDLGGKIGPRLVDLIVQATLATRRGLAPHEARVRAAGTQAVIDRSGAELADLIRPLLADHLADPDNGLHPDLQEYLAKVIAGTHQYHTWGGFAFGLSQSLLSNVLSNALAPLVYKVNRASTNMALDPQTTAAAWAAGLIGQGQLWNVGAGFGYGADVMNTLADLAQSVPPGDVLGDLVNRGLIDGENALYYLHRSGVPEQLRDPILQQRYQLLTGADLALASLRGDMTPAAAAAAAAEAGWTPARFGTLLANTGEPLGLEQLLEAYRRGYIDEARLERGIRQSRVRDEWIPTAQKLRYVPMSTADAADAALRGHLDQAQARAIAEQNGLLPDQWAPYYANQGNPLAPEQLLELWRRGFIDQSRVELGLREGRTRDEWIPDALKLRTRRLPTADAIDAWLRGHLDHDQAAIIAEQNGLAKEDLAAAFGNAGNPLSLTDLMDAWRRGYIDQATFERGFRESRYRDEWAPTAVRLRYSPMSTADAIETAVQGYLTFDQAAEIAQQNGLEPSQFRPLYERAGNPISPGEAATLFNRGLIDRTQYATALRESRLKDKYIPQAIELHVRLPQEYQIVQMLKAGAIQSGDALKLLEQLGYTAWVSGRVVAEATATGTSKHKETSQAQTIALYEALLIDHETAAAHLALLGYDTATAQLLLDLADHNRHQKILNTGLASVRKQYLAWNATDLEVRADLLALAIPTDAIDLYLQVWTLERKGQVRTLTEAQVVKAYTKSLFNATDPDDNQAQACARLTQLGYSPDDATLLLAGA